MKVTWAPQSFLSRDNWRNFRGAVFVHSNLDTVKGALKSTVRLRLPSSRPGSWRGKRAAPFYSFRLLWVAEAWVFGGGEAAGLLDPGGASWERSSPAMLDAVDFDSSTRKLVFIGLNSQYRPWQWHLGFSWWKSKHGGDVISEVLSIKRVGGRVCLHIQSVALS